MKYKFPNYLDEIQKRIINYDINTDILVSAGAGSGKTTVLTQKIIKHIENNDLQFSELLVLTFTDKAAHKMKIDVLNNIDPLLKIKASSAHIQTFDSFINELARKYSQILNIPEKFFIANNDIIYAKKMNFLDEIFTEFYKTENLKDYKDFITFLSKYNIKDDRDTKDVIIDIYDKFESMFHPIKEITKINFLKLFKDKTLFDTWAQNPKFDNWTTNEKSKLHDFYYETEKHVDLIFKICDKLHSKLNQYKKQNSIFTYNDLANQIYLLLANNEKISLEIRKNFKYIMIDEYQDTNDLQDAIINILLLPKDKNGNRAHCFKVGDIKQSIYKFRNANVNIMKDLEKSGKVKVEYMNTNYRSCNEIINQCNAIFTSYMQPTEFKEDSISFDQNHKMIFGGKIQSRDGYGITRIIPTMLPTNANAARSWEAETIAFDINNKIKNHFQVYDVKEGFRDCRWSDFAIIMRNKKFNCYQKIFAKAGMPLNCKDSINLIEINCIMAIESLVRLVYFKISNNLDLDELKHSFASIARSYLYQYTDGEIYTILNDDTKFEQNEIFSKVDEFIKNNKNKSLHELFINLINEFAIIKKLHTVGDLSNNVSKIESLYKIIIDLEESGNLLADFVNLMKLISKYKLEMKRDSLLETNNAVQMMSIHQAKGLEFKIVYLPVTPSSFTKRPAYEKPDYIFSNDKGILLPCYSISFLHHKKTIPEELEPDADNNMNEHIRLHYVALTRATNCTYIVGVPYSSRQKGTFYHMFSKMTPDEYKFNKSGDYSFQTSEYPDLFVEISDKEINNWKLNLLENKPKFNSIQICNDLIKFDKKSKKARASISSKEDEAIDLDILDRGTRLHQIMETIDLNNPKLDVYKDDKEALNCINTVLSSNLIKSLSGAKFLTEFGYYDKHLNTTGFIDLVAIKNGVYYIIDYKTSDIDAEKYKNQLNTYAKNLADIMQISISNIKLYLLSLTSGEYKAVPIINQ